VEQGPHHWALRDVSFEVLPGDVVGIVGRNGAGKSTLLKVLSRITEPTDGRVELRGRVGSLLEVGTGFHQELTGRENVYLNGAILGMTRREIDRKFDEIVAFAEIDAFLDTPVKRYSSGMYTRLAFAVAAHLDPEILIIDEVLAVGDVQFQKKCLGKMGEVARSGRTILFVSHNVNAVQRLCNKVLLLSRGRAEGYGDTAELVQRYLEAGVDRFSPGRAHDLGHLPRKGTGEARFARLAYTGDSEATAFQPYPEGPVELTLTIDSDADREVNSIGVTFCDRAGTKLVNADTTGLGEVTHLKKGPNEVRLRLHRLHLNPGVYVVALWLARRPGNALDYVESAGEIEVVEPPAGGRPRPEFDGVVTCSFDLTVRGPA
jgi:ABC-type polysaccharide/polyol phosphate transport system ATPase subunit